MIKRWVTYLAKVIGLVAKYTVSSASLWFVHSPKVPHELKKKE
ncbi:cyclic lactone autoinducer peptide [Longirhabdus pacifica]|nr:cyclic lactone autoinducer peptide [Longirhabdus pacifica]